ncbi:hypothetical protein UYO_2096 [Lachnospiraceae bacterium JC7]|nr:hypothetical protein UYO_2096 [Lachnospiraceae bacterium JC7]
MAIAKTDKKYPYKKQINLMYKKRKVKNLAFTLVLFAVYLVCLFFFTKYGVYEELSKADHAEQIYRQKLQELQEIQEKNNEFSDVRAEYSHYGNSYMNTDESAAQDMVTMLNIIDERIHDIGAIQSASVTGNIADIKLGIDDANRLPEIIRSLEESEYINYVTAQTASTVDQNYSKAVLDADGNVIVPQYVDAAITVHFRSPEEVEAAVSSGNSEVVDAYLDASPTGLAVGDNAYVPYIMEIQRTEPETAAADSSKTESSEEKKSSSKSDSGSKKNSSGSGSSNGSSSGKSSGSSGSKSGSKTNSQAAAQQQAAAAQQQAAAAQAAAQQQAAAAQSGGGNALQNVVIDTPNFSTFGNGVSIQGGSPLG